LRALSNTPDKAQTRYDEIQKIIPLMFKLTENNRLTAEEPYSTGSHTSSPLNALPLLFMFR